MQEVNINNLLEHNYILQKNIPDDIIIVGKKKININNIYDKLDLSKLECEKIYYSNQKGESIKNHILPNTLEYLDCPNNRLTLIPNKLPNSLKILDCSNNQLISFPNVKLPDSLKIFECYGNQLTSLSNLPNSLKFLYCHDNQLKSLPDNLPNSLKILKCDNNQLISLPDLPNSLEYFECSNNKLTSLSDLPNNIRLCLKQKKEIEYIPYYKNIKIYNSNFKIKNYPIRIANQEAWDEYMNSLLINKVKSARK